MCELWPSSNLAHSITDGGISNGGARKNSILKNDLSLTINIVFITFLLFVTILEPYYIFGSNVFKFNSIEFHAVKDKPTFRIKQYLRILIFKEKSKIQRDTQLFILAVKKKLQNQASILSFKISSSYMQVDMDNRGVDIFLIVCLTPIML